MTNSIENLIGALRQESEQYRAMIGLLELQQQQIGARRAEDVYHSIGPIKVQGQAIQKARAWRDECRAQVAVALQRPPALTFAELIPLLPTQFQPVILQLVKENNDLLGHVHQRSRQNHLRLSRSIEMIQSLMNSILPAPVTRVYNDRGSVYGARPAQRVMYEAIG